LAAVGATGWVFMFNSMLIQGFTQGFGIQIAKMVGENDTVTNLCGIEDMLDVFLLKKHLN